MNFLKNFKSKHMTSNFSLAVLSGIIAVIIWLFISLTQYPTVQKTVENIPVTVDISGSAASQNGLSVISCDVEKVTVELLGSRTQIGYLNNESLTAYFDADSVSGTGTKKLALKLKSNDSDLIYDVKSISPAKATVVFDKIETREFEVLPRSPNVTFAEGKEIDLEKYVCTPSVISITGPTAQLDKIQYCYAVLDRIITLSNTYNVPCDKIELYTKDNVLIDQSALKFSDMNISLTIPVRSQKTVDLYVSIANAPENFDQDIIKYKLSSDKVTLACNNTQIEIPDSLDIGYVPLYEIKPGYSKTFSLATRLEGSELINVSDLNEVTVTFEGDDLDEVSLTLDQSHIKISNPPDSNYNYDVLTQQMNITVIGPSESISQITADDIIGEVNLLNTSITTDQFNQNVTFSCPAFDDVWVTTNTKVSVQRTKIEAPTAAAAKNSY
ncbi:MAG: hypothetical protein J6B75_00115 [Ruminococcus sp.]|nr:hypothetical protein [Ruminococcus sp.]